MHVAHPDMLSSALMWLFPKQKLVIELQVSQSQAVAYLRNRVRRPSRDIGALLKDFDGIVGRVEGQEIILRRRCVGRRTGDAQEFRGQFVTDGPGRYIVGDFAQAREVRIVTLAFAALLAASGIVLLGLAAFRGDIKGAAAAAVPAFMLAAVLGRTRVVGWSTLDDIPVIEQLLREAAGERVV